MNCVASSSPVTKDRKKMELATTQSTENDLSINFYCQNCPRVGPKKDF